MECVIFVGLPGAGKSSLYREKFATTHVHVSKDLWPKAADREKRQAQLITESLGEGRPVVVDNTNPTMAERKKIMTLAREYGARVICYHFDVSTRAAVARNAARTGKGKVPNVAIFTTAKRLQPPMLAEGFDELFRVTIAEDRSRKIQQAMA